MKHQHGVIARRQLLEFGMTPKAIDHRIASGRLHPVWQGVYAAGRRELTKRGEWMVAILGAGPGAVLSHFSAAALWGIYRERPGLIEISVPRTANPRRKRLIAHRRNQATLAHTTRRHRIPVTTPLLTLIDIAGSLTTAQLERAINEADKLGLIRANELRAALAQHPGRPGVAPIRRLLDRHEFVLTASQLERLFVPIARRAGLPTPETGVELNGYDVDFYWPQLGLVVEADGLTYHRTPAEQAKDRLRDQAHTAAGLTQLRFTHWQIRYDPPHVEVTLKAVASRLDTPRRKAETVAASR